MSDRFSNNKWWCLFLEAIESTATLLESRSWQVFISTWQDSYCEFRRRKEDHFSQVKDKVSSWTARNCDTFSVASVGDTPFVTTLITDSIIIIVKGNVSPQSASNTDLLLFWLQLRILSLSKCLRNFWEWLLHSSRYIVPSSSDRRFVLPWSLHNTQPAEPPHVFRFLSLAIVMKKDVAGDVRCDWMSCSLDVVSPCSLGDNEVMP